MTTALAEREPTTPALPKDQIELVRRTVANGATNDELALFLYDCQRRGIHPLDKLLHFTKRSGRYTPVTSIDFMRSQAAMTGEMAGSDDAEFIQYEDKPHPDSATVTVYRLTQGQRFAYTATARWSEYCPDNAPMWKRMPHTMLGKCAEALALRKAFPQQLAGLYSREEMDQADSPAPARGYVVDAPAPTEKRENTSDPNVGASGANVYAPSPEAWPPLPSDDAVFIDRVSPGQGKVIAEIRTHTGETLPVFKDQLKALAEQLCQDRAPVLLETKLSGTSGKPYIVGIKRAAPIPQAAADFPDALTVDDIPF